MGYTINGTHFMTLAEVMQKSGFCQDTIYNHIHAGRLKAQQRHIKGRRGRPGWLIEPKDYAAWMARYVVPDVAPDQDAVAV